MSMASRIIIAVMLVLLFGALWAWLAPVKADQQVNICGAPAAVMTMLERYREVCDDPITFSGKQVSLCKNDNTGTWSMVVIHPQVLCVIAVGRDRRPKT